MELNTKKMVMSFEEFIESEKGKNDQTNDIEFASNEEPVPATEVSNDKPDHNLSTNMMDDSDKNADDTDPDVSLEN